MGRSCPRLCPGSFLLRLLRVRSEADLFCQEMLCYIQKIRLMLFLAAGAESAA